ncbi:MAG: DUF502 domain-containing protein [Calditrichaceae bacterium]
MTKLFYKIKGKSKGYLISGVLIVVPLVITFIVIKAIFISLDNLIRPVLEPFLGFWPIGIGLVITIILIWFIGLLTSNILIGRLLIWGEKLMYKIPIAKVVYSASKQLMETFSKKEKQSFQRVVFVEYPGEGIWSVGFVNGEIMFPGESVKKLNVLVLAAINPTSGFFIMVPENKTIPLNISVEEGMKWVVSGGIIKPDKFKNTDIL